MEPSANHLALFLIQPGITATSCFAPADEDWITRVSIMSLLVEFVLNSIKDTSDRRIFASQLFSMQAANVPRLMCFPDAIASKSSGEDTSTGFVKVHFGLSAWFAELARFAPAILKLKSDSLYWTVYSLIHPPSPAKVALPGIPSNCK